MKRTAKSGANCHLSMSGPDQTRRKAKGDEELGPATATKGYSSTMAVSTLNKLTLAAIKLELVDREYNPKTDTCIKAFVRLLANLANNTP